MARWLKRIDPRRKKSTSAPPEKQTYEVFCRCGERSIGLRVPRYQQVICKQCGEPLFVLPANVYPAPPPPEPEPPPPPPEEPDVVGAALREAAEDEPLREADGKRKPAAQGDVLAELADESWKSTKAGKAEARAKERRRKHELREKQRASKQKAKKERDENPLTAREPIGQKVRRAFSPFRIIVVSIVGVVIATAAWQIHSRNVESARLRFDTARKKAATLLDEKKFAEAGPLLKEASDAADLVGRDDVAANRVRRLNLEVEVLNDLSQSSFYESINTATTADRKDIAAILMTQLADRWIVFDTFVVPSGKFEQKTKFTVEMPLLVNGILVEATVVGSELQQLKPGPAGTPAVFAAKLKESSIGKRGELDLLRIELIPESIRLWSEANTYAALGFPAEELPAHLTAQRKLLGATK